MYPPPRYMGVSVYGRRVIPIEALVKGRTRRTAPPSIPEFCCTSVASDTSRGGLSLFSVPLVGG